MGAMIRLRRLLAQRLTNPAVASLLLLVVAFRLLLPPGLMLSPSTSANLGDLVICSGHGALFDDTVAMRAAPATTVAVSDLTNALGSADSHADHSHSGDICPFSATLAMSIAVTVLVTAYWLQSIASTRAPRPADDAGPAVTPTYGPFGARAPPLTALS
ncbi:MULTISPECIES: DUF2946 family protein [Burkholderia]|uniref:DUF2946 family protein n=1 Tax=Burkholderia TaxID=32008 RepID=UPI0015897756|nr:DUF2946 family protein [Burkholderia seminalis]